MVSLGEGGCDELSPDCDTPHRLRRFCAHWKRGSGGKRGLGIRSTEAPSGSGTGGSGDRSGCRLPPEFPGGESHLGRSQGAGSSWPGPVPEHQRRGASTYHHWRGWQEFCSCPCCQSSLLRGGSRAHLLVFLLLDRRAYRGL